MTGYKLAGIDQNWIVDLLIGLGAGIGYILMASASSISIGIPEPIIPQSIGNQVVNMVAGWLVVGVLAVLFEEPLFRGVILYLGINVFGVIVGIVLTAVSFSMFHWQVYGESMSAAFLGAALFSVISSIMTIVTKSILPAMIMHSAVNTYTYLTSNQYLTIGGVN